MANSSVLWGLASGVAFVLAIVFLRFGVPKLVNAWRKLSKDANSLLAPSTSTSATLNEVVPHQALEAKGSLFTPAIQAEAGTPAVRMIATVILVVAWPIFTFVLPFTAFFPPLLFVYIAYPVIWYYSGLFYKSALAKGKRNLLMASAPLLFLLVVGAFLGLVAAVLVAFGK
ncbi:MAG: hypothetical protein HYY97_09155 [Rhodocyclales bacterium]|nr:hypothetical protein [Rhodocyclales bacterium]